MKLILYTRATSRSDEATQLRQASRFDIHFTVRHGEGGRTFDHALQQLHKGRGLLIESFHILGRKREDVCKRIKMIFAKQANIVTFKGERPYTPSDQAPLIEMLKAKGITVNEGGPKPRVAHNKADPEAVKYAKRLWTQKQFGGMKNADVAEETGFTAKTLTKWFGPRSDYIDTKPGRPRRK